MVSNEINTRIIAAIAKLTGYKTENFYIQLFSDGSGNLIFTIYPTLAQRPVWCLDTRIVSSKEFIVFDFYNWNLEDAFVKWYEKHFERTTKIAKLYNILNLIGLSIY